MRVVAGVDALTPDLGPAFVVVGVFDGLHLGHLYLLHRLVEEADARHAQATVITFDHHPDEVLTGAAPPLLIDPEERLSRLEAAGIAVTVVQHFDQALRRTPYDEFVERIRSRIGLAGFLMTPDAAFGFERRGTPEALATLGERDGFEVVVIPPFTLDGRPVRSTEIRAAIATGDLPTAAALLGRPVSVTGQVDGEGLMRFALPIALPPQGDYEASVGAASTTLTVRDGQAYLRGTQPSDRATVELVAPGWAEGGIFPP
jgi:riboflavin kinase/FMN adenylyltransferase